MTITQPIDIQTYEATQAADEAIVTDAFIADAMREEHVDVTSPEYHKTRLVAYRVAGALLDLADEDSVASMSEFIQRLKEQE